MDGKEIYHFWYYEDRYYFNCQTKSGWIIKSIVFNQLEKEEFFNLALFDYLEVEKEWSDTNRSHPIKLSMLFFTVCAIVLDFLKKILMPSFHSKVIRKADQDSTTSSFHSTSIFSIINFKYLVIQSLKLKSSKPIKSTQQYTSYGNKSII